MSHFNLASLGTPAKKSCMDSAMILADLSQGVSTTTASTLELCSDYGLASPIKKATIQVLQVTEGSLTGLAVSRFPLCSPL